MLNHAQLREKSTPLKRTPFKHCLSTRDQHVVPRRYMSTRRRAVMRACMTDSFWRGCPGHVVRPYGMQHGSERRLLGRLLGPATMNICVRDGQGVSWAGAVERAQVVASELAKSCLGRALWRARS